MYVQGILLFLFIGIVTCDSKSTVGSGKNQSSGEYRASSADGFRSRDGYEKSSGRYGPSDGYRSSDGYESSDRYRSSDGHRSLDGYVSSDKYDYHSSSGDRYRSSDGYRYSDEYEPSDRYRSSDGYRSSDRYRSSDGYRSSDRYRSSDGYRSSDRYRSSDGDRSSDEYRSSDRYRSNDRYESSDRYDYRSSSSDEYRSSDRYSSPDRYRYSDDYRDSDDYRYHDDYRSSDGYSSSDRSRSSDGYESSDYDYKSSSSEKYSSSSGNKEYDLDSLGINGHISSAEFAAPPATDGYVSTSGYEGFNAKTFGIYDPKTAGGYKGYNDYNIPPPPMPIYTPGIDPVAGSCYPFMTFSLGVAAGYMLKTCPHEKHICTRLSCMKGESFVSLKVGRDEKSNGKCPSGWFTLDEVKNKCFRFTINELEWEQARIECNELGGNLAIIKDGKKSGAITHFLDSHFQADLRNGNIWIGLSDLLDEKLFVWDPTNKIAKYHFENWFENNPPGKDEDKNCVALLHDEHWVWDHFNCHDTKLGLCERHVDEISKCNTY